MSYTYFPSRYLRERALRQLKRKRELRDHLGWFLFVNAVLWVIWAIPPDSADTHDLCPAWVTGIWGVFLLSHAWRVYRDVDEGPTEHQTRGDDASAEPLTRPRRHDEGGRTSEVDVPQHQCDPGEHRADLAAARKREPAVVRPQTRDRAAGERHQLRDRRPQLAAPGSLYSPGAGVN